VTPQQLIDTAARHQVFLEGLKSNYVQSFSTVFDRIDKLIKQTLNSLKVERLDEVTRPALEQLLHKLQVEQTGLFDTQVDSLLMDMPAVAENEARFEANALRSVIKPKARSKVKVPTAAEAHVEAIKRPIQATGEKLEPFFRDWTKRAVNQTNGALRLGYDQGQTTQQIIRRLEGTKALRYKDGLRAVQRRQAEAVVRTGIQHVAATAREVTYEQNSDVVIGVEWVATLDSKTTSQCRSLDGKKFKLEEGPRPPIHPRCRSTTAPDLDPAFDFLDEGATRSSVDGPVSADETYYSWLKKQDASFQDEVLGKERANLFRDGGLSPQRFANLQLDKNFKPITLAQMRELEPLAFQRAGLKEEFEPEKPKRKETVEDKIRTTLADYGETVSLVTKDKAVETLAIVDKTSKTVLASASGTADNVEPPPETATSVSKLKEAGHLIGMIHNHPDGGTLSMADISQTYHTGVNEVVAVASDLKGAYKANVKADYQTFKAVDFNLVDDPFLFVIGKKFSTTAHQRVARGHLQLLHLQDSDILDYSIIAEDQLQRDAIAELRSALDEAKETSEVKSLFSKSGKSLKAFLELSPN
jgi:SPP1 gp7 family putative phage head morphogenesis protein